MIPFHLSEIFFHQNFDLSKCKVHNDFDSVKSSEIISDYAIGFFRVKTMSENGENGDSETETVEALKAKIADLEAQLKAKDERITELEAENQKLRETLEKGTATLEMEIEEQKAVAIKTITEKTNFSKDELEKMKLPALRLILKTIGSAKGTVKNIRSAGAGSNAGQSKLTVGDLYHKEK